MKTTASTVKNTNSKVICVGIYEDIKELSDIQNEINEKYSSVMDNVLNNFNGKFLETMTFPLPSKDIIIAVGLGKIEELNNVKIREFAKTAVNAASKVQKGGIISVELIETRCANIKTGVEIILGAGSSIYSYDKYKTSKKEKAPKLEILTNLDIKDEIQKADIINAAIGYTRDMVFESAEVMTPSKVAQIAQDLAEEKGIEIKVFDKKELKKMNFNAFLAVGQGSAQEPKFIHLTYKSKNPKKKIVLIGKGITFDSGGLDIKPPSSMLTMKTDMTGAATVLGVMKAICELKPKIELHVLSALCENMPSGSSYKVGDVIVSKSGKTIEVDNTDAEGRLTLADVLTYSDEIGADEVIDIATLTGAVIVALGNNITGIMGNNQAQIDGFKKTADEIGENVWQLPIYDDMAENLKSDIADMKNTGSRYAGSSVAGRFLQNFTQSKSWLHIDIAGTAYTDKPYRDIPKGATGVMIKTLVKYLAG